jgi:hypothetical protein
MERRKEEKESDFRPDKSKKYYFTKEKGIKSTERR